MLPSYFLYIFVHLRQKVRPWPALSPKFLSTLGPNPTRKARPDLQLWVAYNIAKGAKQQNILCIDSSLKFLWYGSMEWNMEENFSMEWNMEENFSMKWKIFGMEWKRNGRKLPVRNMEKSSFIPFHTMPCT